MLASRRIVNAVSPHIASRAMIVGGARKAAANVARNKLPSRGLQHTAAQTDRVTAYTELFLHGYTEEIV